jgi:DNA-binding NarL/FixJ family response regulator
MPLSAGSYIAALSTSAGPAPRARRRAPPFSRPERDVAADLVYFHGVQASDQALRVVIADDHHFFREGLRRMLTGDGIAVVGEATDGAGAVRLARELAPDVVVIDLKMPNASGVDAIRQIAGASSGTHLVVLTVSADESDAIQALAAGAAGYLLKDTRPDELVNGIRLAADGHAVLSREVVRALVEHVRADNHATAQATGEEYALSERELEVLRMIVDGFENAAIGRALSISRHTVKQHVTNIYEKLGVQSRVQAAVHAVRNGLV